MKTYTSNTLILLGIIVLVICYFLYIKNKADIVALEKQNIVKVNPIKDNTAKENITEEMRLLFTNKINKLDLNRGWKVVDIKYDAMCDGSDAYDISVIGDMPVIGTKNQRQSFIFNKAGDFIQSEVDKQFTMASPILNKALKDKYSQYTYGDTYESLRMANGEERYLVDISSDGGKTTAEVILGVNGNLICQTKAK